MPEEADDALDGFFEPVEILKRRVHLERAIHKYAPEPRILGGIDELRLANGGDHALRSGGVESRIGAASIEVFPQGHPMLFLALVCLGIEVEDGFLRRHSSSPLHSARRSGIRPKKAWPAKVSSPFPPARSCDHMAIPPSRVFHRIRW